ncbi:MAG: hypothetical protein ACJA13_000135, partial [Paraglaciecola sp.]
YPATSLRCEHGVFSAIVDKKAPRQRDYSLKRLALNIGYPLLVANQTGGQWG